MHFSRVPIQNKEITLALAQFSDFHPQLKKKSYMWKTWIYFE